MSEQTKVFLRGGPDGLAEAERVRHFTELPDKVVVVFNGGSERFEPVDECLEVDGEPTAVFQWSYRTRIAE